MQGNKKISGAIETGEVILETVLIRAEDEKTIEKELKKAGEIIKNGGLVAFPTETVYGLGGDALNRHSSEKIYEAKGRPSDNPLIVHICEVEDLEKIAQDIPKEAYLLAEKFWPGPLTMIFQKKECVPPETTGGLGTVAVRMPKHELALEFIREAGGFVAAPSANRSGRPSPTLAEHVLEDLNGRIEMILDGGEVGIGLESTIVDMTVSPPVILRPGFINEEMLNQVLDEVTMDRGLLNQGDVRPKAPGMKYRHYAPKAEMTLIEGEEAKVAKKILELAEQAARDGKKVGIITCKEHEHWYRESGAILKIAGSLEQEETIAHNLYRILREFDEEDAEVIFAEAFETPNMGTAIMNRLQKAAGHKIIDC